MKKLCFLLVVIAIISCKKEIPVNYALISGKITNPDTKRIVLRNLSDMDFRHKIVIADDGTFLDTVKIAGDFMLYQARNVPLAKNVTPLHLKAGNNITINFDAKDYQKSIIISGKGSEISSYLVAKLNKEKELIGKKADFYKQEETAYKKAISIIKTAHKKILAENTGVSEDYRSKEKRNIQYAYLEKLDIYKGSYSYYAKKKDFEPSKEFLNELKDITYDNEEDYNFSSAYKSLVSSYYKNISNELTKENKKLDGDIAMLSVCASIKNQTIKNALIYEASSYTIMYYTEDLEGFYTAYKAAGSTDVKNNDKIKKSYEALEKIAKGNSSPKFVNYENNQGGTTSLNDLKGKYVYIDIWATTCGPCKAEIPFLQKIEKQYHGKNIYFLSVSVDFKKQYQKWKDMIKEKELGGIQLLADKNWKSQFVQDYLIQGIPHFILLDPQGNIVTANAPKPSEKELSELFEDLKI